MAVKLHHAEALRYAADCGTLVRNLYGRPGLVIGIARGGSAIAGVFAESSGAEAFSIITQQRLTSSGRRGQMRKFLARAVPSSLRLLYKQIFFKLAVRITHRLGSPDSTTPLVAPTGLATALKKRGVGNVWVIDDAIDSGGTVAKILRAIRNEAPDARVLLFTLTTSAGIRIAEQINLFAERIDYVEGDISQLSEPRTSALRTVGATDQSGTDGNSPGESRHLYLDIDSVLTRSLIQSSITALRIEQWRSGSLLRASMLTISAMLFNVGLVSRQSMARRIDNALASMRDDDRASFSDRLIIQLVKNSRWSLVSIASAGSVNCQLVTSAPAFACHALLKALELDLLIAPVENEASRWLDDDQGAKARIIAADISKHSDTKHTTRTLVLGRELASAPVSTQQIVAEDRTGLLTILTADSWWSD